MVLLFGILIAANVFFGIVGAVAGRFFASLVSFLAAGLCVAAIIKVSA